MGFKVAVVYFSRRGRMVVLANVIAAGARQVRTWCQAFCRKLPCTLIISALKLDF